MAEMGRYCKAYPIEQLQQYSKWTENSNNYKKEKTQGNDKEAIEVSTPNHLYLQETLVVTDGIFKDENIIFADVTPEWIDFCQNTLKFEVPVFETIRTEES